MRNATILLAVMAVLAFSVSAQAADYDWNTGGGIFQTAGSWTPAGGPPGVGDTANFNLGTADYTVTFSANVTTDECNVKTDILTFDLTDGVGGSRTCTTAVFNLALAGQTGALTLKNGTLDANGDTCYIGDGAGSSAILTVQDGATFKQSKANRYAKLADDNGSTGALTVKGAGSTFDVQYFDARGQSTIDVENGGVLDAAGHVQLSWIRDGELTTVTVDGGSSQFNVGRSLTVGKIGTATMTVSNGGALSVGISTAAARQLNIGGNGTGSFLTVGVTGTGTLTTGSSTTVRIGSGTKAATLTIGAGGTATTSDVDVYDNGTLDLTLGEMAIASDLDVNVNDDATAGSLKFTFNEIANVQDNGKITVDGNVDLLNVVITFDGSGLTDGFDDIDFITATGTITTTGMTHNLGGAGNVMDNMGFDASDWTFGVVTGSSNILRLSYVPEPATMVLLGLGGIGVLLRRRRK